MKTGRNISRKADFAPSPPLATSARAAKPQRKDGEVEGGSAIGIWIIRSQAFDIGRYLATLLRGKVYAPDKISGRTNRQAFYDRFHEHQQWVLVMTTGIAVRYLHDLLTSKESDPGVVVLDEGRRFAVSLVGGHEGGANQLAYRVANLVGAVPVITTATETLKPLVIGVGCRRGVRSEQIGSAIEHGLARINRSPAEVREIATIDLKQDEPGLKRWCQANGVALRIIPRQLVQERPWVTEPSDWVRKRIGVDGVCEPCALLATFRGRLLLPKTILDGVTVAIVEESASAAACCHPIELPNYKAAPLQVLGDAMPRPLRGRERTAGRINMESKGKLNLVSVGPGFMNLVPPLAEIALRESDVVVGYKLYFTWIQSLIEGKEMHSFSLTQERERAQKAIACARGGKIVSLVSSGDIGIYGMAPLVFEEMREDETFQLQIIPGVSAANSSAALLGSPLSHDFATLSLSDLLCPLEWIENRARHLAKADLVIALYNVQSQSRPEGIYRVLRILLEEKRANTWCGVVRNAFRPDQSVYLCSLAELLDRQFDMLTTIIVGNRFTQRKGQFIYTPRGYHGWAINNAGNAESAGNGQSTVLATERQPLTANTQSQTANSPVWVFSGTADGNALAAELSGRGHRVIVSTASDYGAELASIAVPDVEIRAGRQGVAARRNELKASRAVAIVDATHPFAAEISGQLTQLATELNIPYIRYERPAAVLPSFARLAPDMPTAARLAIEIGHRIFLATGIKDVETFVRQPDAGHREWFLRITPDTGSLDLALKAGIPRSRICAMQGPFSAEFNLSLWSAWTVDCVVTKESGEAGGFSSKAEAANKLGISLIVVRRPQISYRVVACDFNSVADLLERSLSRRGSTTNALTSVPGDPGIPNL